GTFTVAGAGADIWGTADAFQYVYQPLTGDGQIVARVASQQNTNAWAKAGVMIREDTTAGARYGAVFVTPSNGVVFQRRYQPSGSPAYSTAGGTAPTWMKLVRGGTTLTAYTSADGATWVAIGSDTVSMGANVEIGLAVTSHTTGALSAVTFDNVTVVAGPPDTPPTVSLTVPVEGASFTAGATISLSATANDSDGSISKVEFYQGATLIATSTSSGNPYLASWTNVAGGSYTLTAKAYDNL